MITILDGEREFELSPRVSAVCSCYEAEGITAVLNNAAECWSKYTVVFGCVRNIDAGANWVISPSKHVFTAFAFLASGTMQMISLAFRIWRTLMEMARRGTSSTVGNHPSPSC